jgi:colicin import membrane protein
MSVELTVVEQVLPEKFGIEPNKAIELMGSLPLIKQQREELITRFNEVMKLDINDPETAKLASELNRLVVKNRTQGVEKWHKDAKDVFLRGGQFVDAIKRTECAINSTMEDELQKIIKHRENIEKERIEQIRQERLSIIAEFNAVEMPGLADFPQEAFEAYVTGLRAKRDAELRAEQERIEQEKKQRLHQERKSYLSRYADFIPGFEGLFLGEISQEEYVKIGTDAKAEKDKYDKEQDDIRKENERLKIEADKKEQERIAEAKKAQEEADRLLKIQQDKEAKIKAEADAKLKAEQEKARKAQEDAENLRKAEQARIDAENKAEQDRLAEQERIASQGENERILSWVDSFELPETPQGKYGKKSQAKIADIQARFESFKNWAKTLK